jgi:hypothetical protein
MKFLRVLSPLFVSFAATFSSAAHADDWGCEVLLCLSNPAGPMAVSQCVPPIKRLYAAIFKWKPDPFPTCAMATSSDGTRSYANVEYNNYYDPCPAGTNALPSGSNAVQGTPAQVQAQNNAGWWGNGPFTSFSVGIGDGAGLYPSADSPLGRKVCVGNAVGTVSVTVGSSGNDSATYQVGVYDRVAFIDPNLNGFAIKVFMNNNLYRTIRPQF